MSRQMVRLIVVGLVVAVGVVICGCYNPVNWPAVQEEQPSAVPPRRPIQVVIVKEAAGDQAAPDVNVSAAMPAETPEQAEANIRQASEAYYAAVNSMFAGDMGPIGEAWSHSSDITNVDGFGTMYVGWAAVSAALEREAQARAGSSVTASELQMSIKGGLAYTWCVEKWLNRPAADESAAAQLHANNVFRREADGWKLIHHHNDRGIALKKAAEAEANQPAPDANAAKTDNQNLK